MKSILKSWLLLATLCAAPAASAETLRETWYLLRSRANMEIGNYAAAIEAYEKYLELRPDDREALKGIALAHERQGETDKAISRFDIYLRHYPDDADIAFKQAEYLSWSRYAYRKRDAIKYLKLGLAQRDDREQRLKYARLLAADRYDLHTAVSEYEKLLAATPRDEAIRKEYRDLLLWDDRYLSKAISEFEHRVDQAPGEFDSRRQLAVLLSKEPTRIDESSDLYARLVAERPGDFELRREFARVLARQDEAFDAAREQYRQLVSRSSDYDLLGEYAALLAKRGETRIQAIEVYDRMLAERPRDATTRLRRAALYLSRKEQASLALRDYETVLEAEPRNARAHRGAAQALAWLGESDRALYHSNLALTYGDDRAATRSLRGDLSKGREPRVSILFESPWQRGGDFELSGYSLGARGTRALSPFLTAVGAAGIERYEGDDETASGTWYQFGGQYRFDARHRVDLRIGRRGVRRLGSSTSYSIEYTIDHPRASSQTFGVARGAVVESFQSLVGTTDAGIGGATREALFWSYRYEQPPFRVSARPSLGRIDSAREPANHFVDLSGSIEMDLEFGLPAVTGLGHQFRFASFASDHSGFLATTDEPHSGGYFSPQLLLDHYLYAILAHRLGDASELEARLGLRFQYVDDAEASGVVSTGVTASASYTRKSSPSRYLILSAEHDSIADRYERTALKAEWVLVF